MVVNLPIELVKFDKAKADKMLHEFGPTIRNNAFSSPICVNKNYNNGE